MNDSLHPFDRRPKRSRARREVMMRKLFFAPERGLSQDQRQVLQAQRVAAEQQRQRELEESLWFEQPPTEPVIPTRVRKISRDRTLTNHERKP